MQLTKADLSAPSACHLGEGPIWDDIRQIVWFVDILGNRLLTWNPQTRTLNEVSAPQNPAAVMLGANGDPWVPARQGLYRYQVQPQTWTHHLSFQTDSTIRSNDAAVDPWGQLVCGTMHETAVAGEGSLYRVRADGSIETLIESVTISNGIDWSLDRSTMYYIDTRSQRVLAYPYNPDGPLGQARTVTEFDNELGHPDGMTLDASGNLWVALWDAGAVHHLSPEGETLSIIEVSAPYVSSCCFGGPNLQDLYISTAGKDPVTDDPDPEIGGDLYVCEGVGQGRLPVRSEFEIPALS